ncbi:MAG: peptidylprolyl isomerase [Planctomycetota bacterium]
MRNPRLLFGLVSIALMAGGSGAFGADLPAGAGRPALPEVVASFEGGRIAGAELRERLLELFAMPLLSQLAGSTYTQAVLLREEAKKLGIRIEPAEATRKCAERDRFFASQGGFEEEIRRSGLGWYDPRAVAEDMLLFERIARRRKRLSAQAELSEEDTKEVVALLEKEYAPAFFGPRHPRVATVGGIDRTQEDFLRFLVTQGSPVFLRAQVETLAAQKRLLCEAEQRRLLPTALDLEMSLARVRKQVDEQNKGLWQAQAPLTLEGLLASQGRTLEEFKDSLELRAQAATLKLLAPFLTDKALESDYKNSEESYTIVRCAHVFSPFNIESPYNPREVTDEMKQAARARIEEAEAVLKREKEYPKVSEEVFADLVRRYSRCPLSWDREGDLGFLPRDPRLARVLPPAAYRLDVLRDASGRVQSPIRVSPPELLEPLFALEDGTVGAVVESPFGYHLLRRMETRRPAGWESLREMLYEVRLMEKSVELSQELQKKYPLACDWAPAAEKRAPPPR